jgi:Tfp pilus assembly protein PilZ
MESLGSQFAGGKPPVPKSLLRDHRRAVRQRVHTPAYASLQGTAEDTILDLCEILDISERGALLQTPKGWELGSALDLMLDFSETQTKVRTKGEVVWTDAGGRVGVRFPELSEEARRKLQEWLFLNVMVAAANHSVGVVPPPSPFRPEHSSLPTAISKLPDVELAAAPALPEFVKAHVEAATGHLAETLDEEEPEPLVRSDYTTTLSVVAAVQREIEGLGGNYEAALQLVAERARSLTRANGAAVAVEDGAEIICRGSSGIAPPAGVPVDRESGISGRCLQTNLLQRCDNAELDPRVDRESCRELGIQSILAVPVRLGNSTTGLVEVFSAEPYAFGDFEASVLQRLSETVQAVTNRKARGILTNGKDSANASFKTVRLDGPVFSTIDSESATEEMGFLRKHLMVLVAVAVLILIALIYMLGPRIGREVSRQSHPAAPAPAARAEASPQSAALSAAPLDELRQRAQLGDAHAQFALGTRYAMGEDVPQDYAIASRWFLKAAEQGMVLAQDTLGAYYWAGRGVPKDVVKAFYWSSVGKEAGNTASEVRVQFLTPQLTREQAAAIQRQAVEFVKQHPPIMSESAH